MAKKAYKACVEAMCKQCIYDSFQQGAWRQQVEACPTKSCPLWPVRPVSSNTIIERQKAARVKIA